MQRLKVRFEGTDWVPWLILALAAFLRFFLLGIKPPHFDEGINGWFVDQVMKNGFYRYDPTNYHGPLHFYVLVLFQSLFGRNLWAIRLPVVLVSISCVWLALKFEPVVGRNVSRIAALAMAISPGFVFYGRYAIHEVWLQLFSMLFILGLLGLWRRGTLTYLRYAGVGLIGMILTKETYAIHVACALLAIPTLAVSYWLSRVPDAKPAKQTWSWIDLAMIVIVGGFAIVFFYSGTFFNWDGVKGLYLAFKAWTETGAAGHGHEKAWDYWFGINGPVVGSRPVRTSSVTNSQCCSGSFYVCFARSLRISICDTWRFTVRAASSLTVWSSTRRRGALLVSAGRCCSSSAGRSCWFAQNICVSRNARSAWCCPYLWLQASG